MANVQSMESRFVKYRLVFSSKNFFLVSGELKLKKTDHVIQPIVTWLIYFIGLLIMALGIVLTIKANLGVSAWDVLHIGLYYQFGLTIGTWSIITGLFVLSVASLLTKKDQSLVHL